MLGTEVSWRGRQEVGKVQKRLGETVCVCVYRKWRDEKPRRGERVEERGGEIGFCFPVIFIGPQLVNPPNFDYPG